jgi:hypothetical protein
LESPPYHLELLVFLFQTLYDVVSYEWICAGEQDVIDIETNGGLPCLRVLFITQISYRFLANPIFVRYPESSRNHSRALSMKSPVELDHKRSVCVDEAGEFVVKVSHDLVYLFDF